MNSHQCIDCGHAFNEEGQNEPHIAPAVECPNCHSYRTQPSGIPDESNDMLHGLQAMPDSTQDDMSGNPLQEGMMGDYQNRTVRDESFASSVRRADLSLFETPEFETTQIVAPPDLYRHGLETEAANRATVQTPKGITDNLHAALGNLQAWVENPGENGQLRPYRNYYKAIRPRFRTPSALRIGVADPTMAEIINHVAQTDDLTPLYEYRGQTHQAGLLGDLGLAVGLGALNLIPGVGEVADAGLLAGEAGAAGADAAGAAAAGSAAEAGGSAAGTAADAAGGAMDAAGAGGGLGGLKNTVMQNPVAQGFADAYNSPAGKGVRYMNFGNDVQDLIDPQQPPQQPSGAGAGAGGTAPAGAGAGPTIQPGSFFARTGGAGFGWLKNLFGSGADAAGASESAADVPTANAVAGVMNRVHPSARNVGMGVVGMGDDVLGFGGPPGGGQGNGQQVQPDAHFARTGSEDDAYPDSHGEIPKQEDGDYHQQDDGNHHEWQRDISVNDGGGTDHSPSFDPAGPGFGRFLMMLPLLMQYLDSGQDGSGDPLISGLHDSLEKEMPGYLDHADDDAADQLIMLVRPHLNHGASPEANEPNHTDENSGGAHTSKAAALIGVGSDFLPDLEVIYPSLNGARLAQGPPGMMPSMGPPMGGPPMGGPPMGGPPMGGPPMGGPPPMPADDTSQGPVTDEQQAWFADWLRQQGREDEVSRMLKDPQLYADEFARARHTQEPPEHPDDGQSAQPPMPAQEEAPPSDTMPVPPMQQMMGAIERYAADSVAGVCPNCGGHTTELIGEDGKSHCHGCGETFTTDGVEHDSINSTTASTWSVDDLRKEALAGDGTGEFGSDLGADAEPVQGVPMADQTKQRDLREEQDSGHTWLDEDGNPLKVGQEYEMHSAKYDIPDLVRIEAVKPTSLVYTLISEFGIEHSTELTKQEANIERDTFRPTTFTDGEVDGMPGLEDNNDDNTGYQGEPEHHDVSAPTGLVSAGVNPKLAWLQPETFHTSGANYTPMEQRALIEEMGVARNTSPDEFGRGGLDLTNTHYLTETDSDAFLFGI